MRRIRRKQIIHILTVPLCRHTERRDGLFRSAAILFDSNYFSMLYFCCRRFVPASDVEAEARYISHTGGCIIRRVCRRLFFCPECSICRRERAFRQRPERSLRSKSLLSTPATSSSGATEPADPSVIQRKQAKQGRRECTSRRRFSSFAERKRPSLRSLRSRRMRMPGCPRRRFVARWKGGISIKT